MNEGRDTFYVKSHALYDMHPKMLLEVEVVQSFLIASRTLFAASLWEFARVGNT